MNALDAGDFALGLIVGAGMIGALIGVVAGWLLRRHRVKLER